jgi:hypothetical protein
MMRIILPIFITLLMAGRLYAQTNPTPQTLPYSQNFGTTSYNTLPAGWAAWNGLNGNTVDSQADAENSAPGGNAPVTATAAIQTNGGIYGYAESSNARLYIQTSSNGTNGVNQPVLALNTTGKYGIQVSYDVEIISAQARTIGIVMQYRVGTLGSWTTVPSATGNPYSQAGGTPGIKANVRLFLPAAAENQAEIQIRWAVWRGSETGNSSGVGIDNISVLSTDYSITTAGGNLVVTDISGNGETLALSQSVDNIRFAVTPNTRTYSIDGGAVTAFSTPADVALAGANSITVNTAAGNDIINIGAFTANLPSLTINGGTGNDAVNFNGDITFATNANLDVDLQNDDATPGEDQVSVAANANLILSGTGTATVKVSRNVTVESGGSLETENGNLIVEANQQATATSGNFRGVSLTGGALQVNGSGALTVRGRGGNSLGLKIGIEVINAGKIQGGTGTVTVEGIGGSSNGQANLGVRVEGANSRITSSGGAVHVTGTGGGGSSSFNDGIDVRTGGEITAGGSGTVTVEGFGGASSGDFNLGVWVEGANSRISSSGGAVQVKGTGGGSGSSRGNYGVTVEFSGEITAGGSGTVTVEGFGGTSGGSANWGVYVSGNNARIASSGGAVQVNGTGGGSGSSAANYGIYLLSPSEITAGGGGTVTVEGLGGTSSGSSNTGVWLLGADARISSSGGAVEVRATGNSGANPTAALRMNDGAIHSGNNANITVQADGIIISAPAFINAGTGTTTIRPRTAGTLINLGGSDVLSGSPLTLGLADAELDQVTTGTLILGDATSGNLTISADISRPAATNVTLRSGGDVSFNQNFNTIGGTLLLDPGNSPAAVKPLFNGTDATASAVSFASDLAIVINGTTPGDGTGATYTQLTVAGDVNITGVDLILSGSHVPAEGQTFILVDNLGANAITGTFNGLPEGALITSAPFNTRWARISYVGGTGNDVVLTVLAPDYTITTAGGNLVFTDNAGNSDVLSMMPSGANAVFNTSPARNYALDGGATMNFPITINNIAAFNSITINQEGGADQFDIGAFNGLQNLIINGGIGNDAVNFNGDITFATNANLDVDLQDDDATPGDDRFTIAANANLILSGTGTATVKVSRNVTMNSGGSLETENGNLIVEANQQMATAAGSFIGVNISGGALQVNGSGELSVKGRGGDFGDFLFGVLISNAGKIQGGNGAATVEGLGGLGIFLDVGVLVTGANSRISSTGGSVQVKGTGGGRALSSDNYGVWVEVGGVITAGGSGTVTVDGFGGTSDLGSNLGVAISGAHSRITSSGGNVSVTGVEGSMPGSIGIFTVAGGAITTATNGGNITLIANSIDLQNLSAVSTNAGSSVTLRPYTIGVGIDLGSSSDPISGPLGLSDAELDQVTTGTLILGDATSGNLTISADISRPAATNVTLRSGGDVSFNQNFNTNGGTLLLAPGNSPAAVKPLFNGTDATASAVSFASDLAIVINGTSPGNGTGTTYTQLTVAGDVNLTGVDLVLSGSHAPVPGQTFILVNNLGANAITGTFNGLPEGALIPGFLGSNLNATITYLGGTGNDVVLEVDCPVSTRLYVNDDAAGANNGSSWTDAFTDLQDALALADQCANINEIWVAAGTYTPTSGTDRTISFTMKNNLAILGGFNGTETNPSQRDWMTNVTILSGDIGTLGDNSDNSYHVIYNPGLNGSAVLDGFTITGGNANGNSGDDNSGGGMFNINSAAMVANCIFSGNSANVRGGGMFNAFSSPTVTNCSFSGNSAGFGGGMYNSSSTPTVTNCSFSGNSAGIRGGGMDNAASSPTVTNCSFSGNSAGSLGGGGMFNEKANPTVINCSFSGNSSGGFGGGGMFNFDNSSPTLTNCILWGNGSEIVDLANSTPNATYCFVQGGYPGTGNLNVNPLFVNAAAGDLRLQACSPAIDAGNDAANANPLDLAGNNRQFQAIAGGSTIDLGAFEYQGLVDICECFSSNVIFVKANATGANNGRSWDNAFTSLQDAIALTNQCPALTEIWVAAGTYKPTTGTDRSIAFLIKSDIEILGGFPNSGNPGLSDRDWSTHLTTLSGDIGAPGIHDNAYRVVFFDHVSNIALLDGFTITGGNGETTINGGGIYNDGSGIGRQSNPRIANCTITGNVARSGAGLFNDGFRGNSSPEVVNCIFSGNKATRDGGGVYNLGGNNGNSSPAFVNCVFFGNKAERNGGAVFNDAVDAVGGVCSPDFVNCTFSGNQADFGVGGIYNDAFTGTCSPTLVNCILWGNAGQIDNRNATPTVQYSLVQGGHAGTGNLDLDPLFVSQPPVGLGTGGNLRLLACSPAIDAGLDASNNTTTDLDNHPRKFEAIAGGQQIDMGAFEYQQSAPVPTAICRDINAVLNPVGTVSIAASDIDDGSGDAVCGPVTLTINGLSSQTYSCSDLGPNTATLSVYVAQSNRTATCTAVVTVLDNAPPSITCPVNLTVAANGDCESALPDFTGMATTSDNCAITLDVSQTPLPGLGTILSGHNSTQSITLTADDGNGNTSSCSTVVTLIDITPPTALCKDVTAALDEDGIQILDASDLNDGSTDNCGVVNFEVCDVLLSGFNADFEHNNWDFENNGGNGSVVTTPTSIELTGSDNESNDNINTTYCIEIPESGIISFNWLYESNNSDPFWDPFGYSIEGTFIQLTDNDGPLTQNGLQNVSVIAGEEFCFVVNTVDDCCGEATTLITNFGFGICSETIEFTCSDIPSTVVILTVTDEGGNTATCSATVTVEDNVIPAITCPGPQTVNLSSECKLVTPNIVALTDAEDACGILSVVQSPIHNVATPSMHLGTQVVTVTATDNNNNSNTCTVLVTAIDVSDPVITVCPEDRNVTLDENCAITVPDLLGDAEATDNCTYSLSQMATDGTVLASEHNMTHTVTITATDAAGNTATCEVVLTALDETAPVINVCAQAQDVALNEDCEIEVPDLTTLTTASDNCTYTLSQAPTAGSMLGLAHNGTTTVIITATDDAGLTATCAVVLTAKDETDPVIDVCASAQDVNLDGNCEISIPDLTGGCDSFGQLSGSAEYHAVADCRHESSSGTQRHHLGDDHSDRCGRQQHRLHGDADRQRRDRTHHHLSG